MSRYMTIAFKVVVGALLSIAVASCSGFDINGGDFTAATEYPVNLTAGASVDTRIAVDGLALTWEQEDVLKITAVAADGS